MNPLETGCVSTFSLAFTEKMLVLKRVLKNIFYNQFQRLGSHRMSFMDPFNVLNQVPIDCSC